MTSGGRRAAVASAPSVAAADEDEPDVRGRQDGVGLQDVLALLRRL